MHEHGPALQLVEDQIAFDDQDTIGQPGERFIVGYLPEIGVSSQPAEVLLDGVGELGGRLDVVGGHERKDVVKILLGDGKKPDSEPI